MSESDIPLTQQRFRNIIAEIAAEHQSLILAKLYLGERAKRMTHRERLAYLASVSAGSPRDGA